LEVAYFLATLYTDGHSLCFMPAMDEWTRPMTSLH